MFKAKLLSTAAAATLLFGTAGVSAASNDMPASQPQLAQSSDSSGASDGAASDTGPQSDVTESDGDVTPDVTKDDGAEPGTAAGQSTVDGSTMGQSGAVTPMTEQELALRAGDIIGQTVVNQQGDELGEIEDLVLDQNNQGYAVVGVGGFLGIGERDVSIPVSNLKFGADQVVYVGIGDVEDLKAMPEYKEGTWRSLKP